MNPIVGGGGKGPVLSMGWVGSIPNTPAAGVGRVTAGGRGGVYGSPAAGVGGCRDTAGGNGGVYGVGGGGRVGKEGGREEYDVDFGNGCELGGGTYEVDDDGAGAAAPPSLSSL